MRRTVRNGIAIAGMAGGLWFLGQAVAQADQVNNTAQDNSQSSTSQNSDGTTGNVGGNHNSSSNTAHITVSTSVTGGNGGTNTSNVNTGIQNSSVSVEAEGAQQQTNGGAPAAAASNTQGGGGTWQGQKSSSNAAGPISIKTGSVSVEQNANGGNVSGSGNITELPTVNQVNNVSQSNHQTASSTEKDHEWWPGKKNYSGGAQGFGPFSMGGGDEGTTGNVGGNSNESSNDLTIDLSTYVRGGDGGVNDSNVNTGVQDSDLSCEAEHGSAWCPLSIETGSVKVLQNANGGNVSNSGNIGHSPAESTPPAKHEAAGVSAASAPGAKSAGLSSAQPSSGKLAFTGANVGLALTFGLLALGLGAAFTLAGRRRETATV